MRYATRFLLAVLVIAAIPLCAQPRPWQYHFGVGYPTPLGETADKVDGKYHVLFGAVHNMTPALGLRLDAEYDQFDATSPIIDLYKAADGHVYIWSGSADLQFTLTPRQPLKVYVFGGAGGHYKRFNLTSPGLELINVCDFWWDICYPEVITVEKVRASRSEWAYGLNAGAGVGIGTRGGGYLFLEAKYQWIDNRRAIEYVPVTVGFRW